MNASAAWVKYPRTFHHPLSGGVQSDDKTASDISWLEKTDVVVTEKMDGENTTLYSDGFHARSLDTGYHPSRSWLAGFHAERAHLIADGTRICGENLYARHSVAYDTLPSYFLGFSAWRGETCLAWEETTTLFATLNILPAPVLFVGRMEQDTLSNIVSSIDTLTTEGFVIRRASSFGIKDFSNSVVKWVRPDHVQADSQHWSKAPLTPNQLAEEKP